MYILKCPNLKPHSLTGLVKHNFLKMLKTLKRKLIILWTSEVIPVRTEILEKILW